MNPVALPLIAIAAAGAWLYSRKASASFDVDATAEDEGAANAAEAAAQTEGGARPPLLLPGNGGAVRTGNSAAQQAAAAQATKRGKPTTSKAVFKPPLKNRFAGISVPAPLRVPVMPGPIAPIKVNVRGPSLGGAKTVMPSGPVRVGGSPIKVPVGGSAKIPANAAVVSVLNAQKTLQALGIPFGALDGLYGPKTQAAWAQAVAKYPPAQGPEYERRATFGRVDGKTAQVYRPSAERLAAAALRKPTPSSSAVTTPNMTGGIRQPAPPPGYDRARAQKLARPLVNHLRSKGKANYSRPMLKDFQLAAGIQVDGIYGRGSSSALKYFDSGAPDAFYPQGVASYPWAGR